MGAKEAFCLLLWVHQGGQVNAKGLPVYTRNNRASGNCDNPDDCYRCQLMQQEIGRHPPGHANWVCPACLKDVVNIAKAKGVPIHLTGHYSEGQCQFVGCTRPPRYEFREADQFSVGESEDEVESQLAKQSGWTVEDLIEKPRGYSRFLQLVVGDIS